MEQSAKLHSDFGYVGQRSQSRSYDQNVGTNQMALPKGTNVQNMTALSNKVQ